MNCDCLSICKTSNINLRSLVTSYQAVFQGLISQLTSEDYVMLLNDKITKVGRTVSKSRLNSFPAGTSTHISREHFSIKYDSYGNFTLMCLSKNGIIIDEILCKKRDLPYILPKHCIIRFPSTETIIHFRSLIDETSLLSETNMGRICNSPSNDISDNGTANHNLNVISSDDDMMKQPICTERPPYSYSQLIVQAICASPQKKLPLCQIYSFIMEKYPYYRVFAIKSWQNSIRHNLSMKAYFVKTRQQEPKIGHLWMIRPSCEALLVSKRFHKRYSTSNQFDE
ncbi:forkhead box protein K2-like [Anopheles maculipalpis]|uniref:forkhead box protein K2-like n=1 Tax=Anopheles maculipalpis TaxID=1496333 RepID=UPI0021590711|nr:forkhead box protein K2-like [Anopheles maculipalpis]